MTVHVEKAVLRLLDNSGLRRNLEAIGMSGSALETMRELLRMTDEINALVIERAPDLRIFETARCSGLTSLRAECLSLVARGETTLEEVLRVTQERY